MLTITYASITGDSKPCVDCKIDFGYFGEAKCSASQLTRTWRRHSEYVSVSQSAHSHDHHQSSVSFCGLFPGSQSYKSPFIPTHHEKELPSQILDQFRNACVLCYLICHPYKVNLIFDSITVVLETLCRHIQCESTIKCI